MNYFYFLRIIGVVLLMSTFALAQDDSEETLLEQAKAVAERVKIHLFRMLIRGVETILL